MGGKTKVYLSVPEIKQDPREELQFPWDCRHEFNRGIETLVEKARRASLAMWTASLTTV